MTVVELRERGVIFEELDVPQFEVVDGIVEVNNNYLIKKTRERGAFFRDSDGNVLRLGQSTF